METDLRKPAAAPDPVCFDGVNQGGDYAGVDAVRKKFRSFCHSPGYDGCGSCAEHKIKYKIGPVETFISGEDVKTGLADEAQ